MKKFKTPAKLFIFVFTFSFMFSYSLRAQKIKVKTENGIQVVYNPKNPAPPPGTPERIILREDLKIGGEEVEDFVFSEIMSAQVDEEGNIYVLDSKEACVKVFDKDGKHLRTFGKRGQGPGELQFPTRMHLKAGKELMIYDGGNRRLSFYSLNGKCLREIPAGKYTLSRAIPDSKGYIIGQVLVPGDRLVNEITKFDPDLNPVLTIGTVEQEEITPYVLNMVRSVLVI